MVISSGDIYEVTSANNPRAVNAVVDNAKGTRSSGKAEQVYIKTDNTYIYADGMSQVGAVGGIKTENKAVAPEKVMVAANKQANVYVPCVDCDNDNIEKDLASLSQQKQQPQQQNIKRTKAKPYLSISGGVSYAKMGERQRETLGWEYKVLTNMCQIISVMGQDYMGLVVDMNLNGEGMV